VPLNQPAFFGQPQQTGWHGREGPIGLPALPPPMGGTLRDPLGAAGEITPAAASEQDVEQRVDDLTKGGMRYATPPLGRLRRNRSANSFHSKSLNPSNVRAMVPSS
jgi:hypothetical protein